jgi:hypothetical protein
MTIEADFLEHTAEDRITSVPLAHLSLELGHLYWDDMNGDLNQLRALFARVGPWARTAQEIITHDVSPRVPRISTCFLIDDYFTGLPRPAGIIPELLRIAQEENVRIDYLARESGCAEAYEVPAARLLLDQIVSDPPPGYNGGGRPPAVKAGWLCNGERSPLPDSGQAMSGISWEPPSQNSNNKYSIFLDVELWREIKEKGRVWSCAFLAAVWQLLRLGLMRYYGRPIVTPSPMPEILPPDWSELPPVMQLNPTAAPFSAYRTFSILDGRFLETEHAVRMILSQVMIHQTVAKETLARSANEGITLPPDIVDRISYVFMSSQTSLYPPPRA